jgi:IS5 family transposase
MLRTRAPEVSLWEAVLPDQVLRLPEELARVDALLDDPVFFAPFVPFFDPRVGRPSTPMEVYLRMMFLKFRYRLGYDSLCREVADSITWRRFCRIPLDGRVPHATTLMKLTTRCGTAAVDGCNEALLAKAAEAKLLRTARLRADTTVVPADAKRLDAAVQEVWDVHVKEISGRYGKTGLSYSEFVERADHRAIRTGFEAAKKAFGADIAQSYVNHVAGPDDPDSDDDGLREAYVRAAALATVKEVREKVDADALELTTKWFAEHRVAIKGLPDVRQQEYEDIRALATEPQIGSLRPPRTRIEGFTIEQEDGQLAAAPLTPLHLMSDEDGQFPLTGLNEWERKVVLAEVKRPDSRGWYRNPSRAAFDSLGIAYRDPAGNWRSMHPDFVFFNEVGGKIVASIVDPHGHQLDDASAKLKALAQFAAEFGDRFHRIEALAEIPSGMRVLDMKIQGVRDAVLAGTTTPIEYYISDCAVDYDPGSLRGHDR